MEQHASHPLRERVLAVVAVGPPDGVSHWRHRDPIVIGGLMPGRPMHTVGHRGASALAPENTLLAIRVAIAHRLDYVEVDVHLSRDRQLVVHHDAQLVDQNGVRVPVAELTAAELARIPKGDDQVVPTLAEVLTLAADRIGVYIELKAAGTADALGTLLRDWTDAPQLICGSFLPELVAEVRRAAPDVPRSVLFQRTPRPTMIETCRAVAARYAHPCARPIGPGMIAELHAAGLLVMTPHTNSHLEAERFRRAGADLVASDDPRLLAGIIRRAAEERRDHGDRIWRGASPEIHDPARLRPLRSNWAPDARLNVEVAP